ncbi:MAG: hypothetical protein WC637_00240 [Victivallales bacterium]|jgi:hypothetical protein
MNTAEDLSWQIDECARVWESFEYFLDEYVWIEDKEAKKAIKLELWPEQRRVVPALVIEQLLILLKTRQVGLTWLAAALVLWLGIRNPLFLAVIISVNEDLSIEFLNRIYFMLDRLPVWLCPPIKARTKQILEFSHDGGTSAIIKSMPTTEMGAQSKTPNILIMDESCMNRMAADIFNSSYPGIEQAKGQVIVISNSIKTGPGWPWTRDLYQGSMRGLNKFKRIFLAWDAHPGRPKTFLRDMRAAGMDEEDVSQHYPGTEEEAISTLMGSYFGDVLARHDKAMRGTVGRFVRDDKTKEVSFEEAKGGIVEIWRYPYFLNKKWDQYRWLRRYCVGSDVSEGQGRSYSVAYCKDRHLDEPACRIRSNRIDAWYWAEQLKMMSDYYENAILTVERTGAGQTTVKHLEELNANQTVHLTSGSTGSNVTSQYGWHESQEAKHLLSGYLKQWLRSMRGRLYCALLIDECSTWIQHEGSEHVGPEAGKLGDCVIAAGCMLEADQYLEKCEKIIPPGRGWRERQKAEREKGAIWAA